jgi:purine-nucleoside phosphorylase
MTLSGYRKDRPMVLGQHTPISLAREGGLWKRIPFLKDNDGMLPPFMIVVGDRRRVLAAAAPLADHLLLHKEVTNAGWDDEAVFKDRINYVLTQLKGIQLVAQSSGLFLNQAPSEHLCMNVQNPDRPLPAAAIQLSVGELVARRWYVDIAQLISELEWLFSPNGKPEHFSHSRLATALSSLIIDSTWKTGYDNVYHGRIVRRLQYLVDYLSADAGRVNLAVGVFEYMGKPLPLTILETQMGCSAQDINAWEALVNSREDGYKLGSIEVPAKGLVTIRAGTCGGIIIPDGKGGQLEEPFVNIGDVVNAEYSFADGATVRQRAGAWSSLNMQDLERFRNSWGAQTATHVEGKAGEELNAGFTRDGQWPVVHSSKEVVRALGESSRDLGLTCHEGGNFTKESLYLESDEGRVTRLRSEYGALSTEMEHFGLAHLTEELTRVGIPASNGLISTVVGTVPGGSFAMPGSKEEEKANESQGRMLESAMRALWKIAYGQ